MVYGNWADTAYPPVYLPRQPENRLLTALCADSAIAWALLPRTHYQQHRLG
ncbi:hypothetical protein ACNKHR_07360 [Shigella flexneri]